MDLPDQAAARDIALLAAAASGEPAAFELLYDRFERRVYNYVRTFVRQPALAEEVVIDTMLAVWHGADLPLDGLRRWSILPRVPWMALIATLTPG